MHFESQIDEMHIASFPQPSEYNPVLVVSTKYETDDYYLARWLELRRFTFRNCVYHPLSLFSSQEKANLNILKCNWKISLYFRYPWPFPSQKMLTKRRRWRMDQESSLCCTCSMSPPWQMVRKLRPITFQNCAYSALTLCSSQGKAIMNII